MSMTQPEARSKAEPEPALSPSLAMTILRPCRSFGHLAALMMPSLPVVVLLVIASGQFRAVSGFAAWSPADDWSRLSSESEAIDTSALLGADLTGEAARKMEAEADLAAADLAGAMGVNPDGSSSATATGSSPDDALVAEAIETIQNSMVDPADPPLYDSPSSFVDYQASEDAAERAAAEIGLLIRCNESPQELLVDQGRALPELTDEERYDWHQMCRLVDTEEEEEGSERYKTTDFFDLAVMQMFHEHATDVTADDGSDVTVLDAAGVASWLTKALGDETYVAVGQHSKEVSTIVARYGTYGTGYLTEDQFHRLYVNAIVGAVDVEQMRVAKKVAGNQKMTVVTTASIWRDLRNHGILPPAEVEWDRKKAELDAEFANGGVSQGAKSSSSLPNPYDECEILDYDSSPDASSSAMQKASHESIELCSDGKTPKRIRDGMSIFIDEESCIGCMQCATVAPSAFVMLGNGRARAYSQSSAPEVKAAVASCPVSCMHYVGYNELKKYETARENGSFGGRNAHIPLHVAGIDSDANRKSSWYHSLRHKCYTSKQCPQKGCYDCPNYSAPGENPYFQAKHRKAERARAKDLIESGEADAWRKVVEL